MASYSPSQEYKSAKRNFYNWVSKWALNDVEEKVSKYGFLI